MDVFDIIPNDVIIQILSLLNYLSIKSFCSSSETLRSYLNKAVKHKQQLTKGFPRPSGKAKIFKIPENIVKLENIKYFDHDSLKNAINELSKLKLNLVRGDIIELSPQNIFSPYQVIYNGENIVEMEYMTDGEGYLDNEYEIIKNDVPVNYWYELGLTSYNFDLSKVMDECLKNISYDPEINRWCTTFTYNFLNYKIIHSPYQKSRYSKEFFIEDLGGWNKDCSLDYDETLCKDYFTLVII